MKLPMHSILIQRRAVFGVGFVSALLALGWAGQLAAAPPVVSNIRASQRVGTQLVDITYDVRDSDSGSVTVYVSISADAGATYGVQAATLTGHVGAGVGVGVDRHIVWNAGVDWGGQFSTQCKVRITADDGSGPPAPAGMVLIPFGPFQMGDNFFEQGNDVLPVHTVFVSAFFMDKYEVNKELWLDVYTWAIGHGYSFGNGGSYLTSNHPVQTISWYDAAKWCNARSEKGGLAPAYFTDAGQTEVYRTGTLNLTNACVKWSVNGYRLPTEAEWEKAARGGVSGRRYPWGNTANGSHANYSGSGDPFESNSPGTTPVGYYNGSQTPAGVDMANGYGLYDMAGNVWEWCWDWYDSVWYGQLGATANDSRGPVGTGNYRVLRGGAWNGSTDYLRCAQRSVNSPSYAVSSFGFRCVRGL